MRAGRRLQRYLEMGTQDYPGQNLIRREFRASLLKALHFIHHDAIEGDYLEFGVYRGWSLKMARTLSRKCGLRRMRFFGFDSFRGLPDVADRTCPCFRGGAMAATRSAVEKLFTPRELGSRVQLVEGFFGTTLTPETRARLGLTRAAIINVDCDVYESARVVFPFLAPLLQPGTLLFLDDWFCYRGDANRGIQRAFGEWTSTQPNFRFTDYLRYGCHGKVMLCVGV